MKIKFEKEKEGKKKFTFKTNFLVQKAPLF